MSAFSFASANEVFCELLYQMNRKGEDSYSEGAKVREIINCTFEITNPRDRVVFSPQIKFDESFALSKLIWWIKENKKSNQWELCKAKLKKDKYTKQAIIHTLLEDVDGEEYTVCLQFLIRDNKLNLICNLHSNDLINGLYYDIYVFTLLQEIMANDLGIGVGSYYQNTGSIYFRDCKNLLFQECPQKNNKTIKCNETSDSFALLQEIESSYQATAQEIEKETRLNSHSKAGDKIGGIFKFIILYEKFLFWDGLLNDEWLKHISQIFFLKTVKKTGVLHEYGRFTLS